MIRPLMPALVFVLVACGNNTDANKDGIADGVRTPNDTTLVAPSTPVGTVSGIIANTKFIGLEGSQVTLVLGGKSDSSGTTFRATTDVDGNFSFKGVPAGSTGQVIATRAGYATARISVTVPSAAGNFPLNDGNVSTGVLMLTELSATVKFIVYGSNGRPAKGARGVLEVSPAALVSTGPGTYGSGLGVITAEATADDLGVLTFTAVPAPIEMARVSAGNAYSLYVSAWDENGDGEYESLGSTLTRTGASLFTTPDPVIVLPDARATAPLAIVSSTLSSLVDGTAAGALPYRNQVRAADPISVVFNQPVGEKTLLSVKVVAEDCATNVSVKIEQKGPNLLTITPATTWNVGSENHLAIRATGLDVGNTANFTGFFFVIDSAAPRPLGTTAVFQAKKGPGNMNTAQLQTGDELFVLFDLPTTNLSATPPRAFVNVDLNANGSIGGSGDTTVGEFNSPFSAGYPISLAEAAFVADQSTFACRANSYSTRWRISGLPVPAGGIDSGKQFKIIVPRDSAATAGFQTPWGQVFSGEIAGTLTVVP